MQCIRSRKIIRPQISIPFESLANDKDDWAKNTLKQHGSDNVSVIDVTIDVIQPYLLNNDWLLFYKQDRVEEIMANVWSDQWDNQTFNIRPSTLYFCEQSTC
jgi:hypothetical protein